MAITYPLDTPTTVGIESITLSAYNATSTSESPYTYKQQIFSHPGQKWVASITIPTVHRDLAEDWVGFLLALKGQVGTFLLGDPNCTAPRGSASVTLGAPAVAGAGQTGDTLAIDGLPTSVTGYLKRGDYIQLGSGSTATLHKVLVDVDTDVSGAATLDIWPNLRRSPTDNATVTLNGCKGLFRLVNPMSTWDINNQSTYSISFEAVEALV